MERRGRSASLAAVGSTALALAACGAILDLKPLAFGDEDSGPPDDGAPADGDVGPADGDGASVDGPRAPSFCVTSSTAARFCADFDEGLLVGAFADGGSSAWGLEPLTGGASRGLASDAGHSPPASLVASTPHITAGTEARSFLLTSLGVAMRNVDFSFWVFVDDVEVDPGDAAARVVALGGLELGVGSTPYKAHFALDPPDGALGMRLKISEIYHDAAGAYQYREVATSASVTPRVWTRVRMELVFSIATSTATVRAFVATDIQPEVEVTNGATLVWDPAHDALTAPTMTVGLLSAGYAAWTAHFDDYSVTATPN